MYISHNNIKTTNIMLSCNGTIAQLVDNSMDLFPKFRLGEAKHFKFGTETEYTI